MLYPQRVIIDNFLIYYKWVWKVKQTKQKKYFSTGLI